MLVSPDALAQYNTPNTEPVTPDDCQIVAQVLDTQTHYPLSFASFGAACDWQKMNLTVQTTDATRGWRVFFRKPKYDVRSEHATVSYSNSYDGTNGLFGFHEFNCRLESTVTDGESRGAARAQLRTDERAIFARRTSIGCLRILAAMRIIVRQPAPAIRQFLISGINPVEHRSEMRAPE